MSLDEPIVNEQGQATGHRTVGSIPSSVVELRCSWADNSHVPPGSIPHSVKKLILGNASDDLESFPKLLPGVIPPSVTDLHLGYWRQEPIDDGVIPSSVASLTVCQRSVPRLPPEWTDSPALYLSTARRDYKIWHVSTHGGCDEFVGWYDELGRDECICDPDKF